MKVAEIRRYPVKSMLGEVVLAADIGQRGLVGDRLWAVRDPDGKFGSGKNTRRFRRMPGLFRLQAYHDEGPVSLVTTASLRRLTELSGGEPDGSDIDPLRFRANLLIDLPGNDFPEDDWPGRRLRVSPERDGQACWTRSLGRWSPVQHMAAPFGPADALSASQQQPRGWWRVLTLLVCS